MIVHIGVVMIAVALVSTQAYTSQYDIANIKPGQTASAGGHTITYLGTRTIDGAAKVDLKADIRIDGG